MEFRVGTASITSACGHARIVAALTITALTIDLPVDRMARAETLLRGKQSLIEKQALADTVSPVA
jgi:hypothetical protein